MERVGHQLTIRVLSVRYELQVSGLHGQNFPQFNVEIAQVSSLRIYSTQGSTVHLRLSAVLRTVDQTKLPHLTMDIVNHLFGTINNTNIEKVLWTYLLCF